MEEIVALDGCWNKIGVHGDSTCALLRQHVHCRNCSVYSEAAVRLLEGERCDDDLRHWTQSVARAERLEERGAESLIVFRVEMEWLALPTTSFQEIASVRMIHSLPHRRNGVILGLANIRGELLVCASLHHLLGLEAAAVAPQHGPLETRGSQARFIVIQHGGDRAVCPVDEVAGVERIGARHFQALPDTVARAAASYTRGLLAWRDRSLNVLDAERLFHTFTRSMSSVKAI